MSWSAGVRSPESGLHGRIPRASGQDSSARRPRAAPGTRAAGPHARDAPLPPALQDTRPPRRRQPPGFGKDAACLSPSRASTARARRHRRFDRRTRRARVSLPALRGNSLVSAGIAAPVIGRPCPSLAPGASRRLARVRRHRRSGHRTTVPESRSRRFAEACSCPPTSPLRSSDHRTRVSLPAHRGSLLVSADIAAPVIGRPHPSLAPGASRRRARLRQCSGRHGPAMTSACFCCRSPRWAETRLPSPTRAAACGRVGGGLERGR